MLGVAAEEDGPAADETLDLWRGLRNLRVQDNFAASGGTEPAVMSTTTSLDTALSYASSRRQLIFKIRTTSFMNRGASLEWLSAFPAEQEILSPPLTYLRPLRRPLLLDFPKDDMQITVVEVEPMT